MDTIGVSQTDFLSGEISMTFDLEKARDAAKFDDRMAITMFPLAIAEIERLRADYDKLKSSLLVIDGCKKLMNRAARIDELEADNQNLVTLNKSLMNNDWILRDNNRKYRKRAQKAELLNKELKADLEQSERVVEARLEVIDQQAAKIRELEDVHKRSGAKYAKIINELRSSVYANIPGLDVGKIGPDAMPRVWQITQKRKNLLRFLLSGDFDRNCTCAQCKNALEEGRAMLEEARP